MKSSDDILSILLKHPFFRNPNNYYIRRITLIKYLKKKGFNVSSNNFSDELDKVILSIRGVNRAGIDGYSFKKE